MSDVSIIIVSTSGNRRSVPVLDRRGVWALTECAFKGDGPPDSLLVVHVPTGRRVNDIALTPNEARALLELLEREAPDFLGGSRRGDSAPLDDPEVQRVGHLLREAGFYVRARGTR